MNFSSKILNKNLSDETEIIINQLSIIFDKLTSLILDKIAYWIRETNKEFKIHYFFRQEQVFELARLQLHINELVIKKEIPNIDLTNFNLKREEKRILKNSEKINNTAEVFCDALFKNIYKKRWIPKSEKLFVNKTVIKEKPNIKKVTKNHFITHSFIKKFWSFDNQINIFSLNKLDKSKIESHGKFGHKEKIYSDELEHYFGLIEGDLSQHHFSKQNLFKKLISLVPMNQLEIETVISFIVIHFLRNPYSFKDQFEKYCSELTIHYPNINIYETLFQNNELYEKITHNILINQWIVLKSENKMFVLADTVGFYKLEESGQIILFPISPEYCLLILPFKDKRLEEEKIVPLHIKLNKIQELTISSFLVNLSYEKFIASKDFNKHVKNVVENNISIYEIIRNLKTYSNL